MSTFQDSPTQDQIIKLVESNNRRLDNIYKQLCEYEESIDSGTSEDYDDCQTRVMDLLETIETIQEAAAFLRPYNLVLHSQQQSLEEQMKCLDQSVDLLKLETGTFSKLCKTQE